MIPELLFLLCLGLSHTYVNISPSYTSAGDYNLIPPPRCEDPVFIELFFGRCLSYLVHHDAIEVCLSPYELNCGPYLGFAPWIVALVYAFLAVVIPYVLYKVVNELSDDIGRKFLSSYFRFLMYFTKQPVLAANTCRNTFNKAVHVQHRVVENHTHPLSAGLRSATSMFIDKLGNLLGKRPYFMQMSVSDQKRGRDGSRAYYWAKDMGAEAYGFKPKPNDLLAAVDVDMYLDMPTFLSRHSLPLVISTFQPGSVSRTTHEYSYTFDSDNNVEYMVSGGAVYKHPVWNYGIDILCATEKRYLGLYYRTTIYNVDRRQITDDHQIILLTPLKRIVSPFIDIARYLGYDPLERYKVVQHFTEPDGSTTSFTRLALRKQDGLYMSTGRPSQYLCSNIPIIDDEAISNCARITKVGLAPAQVKSLLGSTTDQSAYLLTDYHRRVNPACYSTTFSVEESVVRYQYDPPSYEPDAKASLKPFMNPFINDCYSPDKTKGNEQASIDGRITEVKAPDDLILTPDLVQHMHDFLELFIPDSIMHTAHPCDDDLLYERQNRPTQRRILDDAGMSLESISTDPVKTFMKSEGYGKITDPRIISTLPPVNKRKYSKYMYPFSAFLRTKKWYGFGKTPKEIAESVANICLVAKKVTKSDLSRCDGRVSKIAREIEKMAMMRFYHVDYHRELAEIMSTQVEQVAYTRFNLKYRTGQVRLSGSPETADMNTFLNKFMGYVTVRRTRITAIIISPQEAYEAPGIYAGDDGLTADVDDKIYEKTCLEFGQVLEAESVYRGDEGVDFLARIYSPEVWFGSTDSMCDVRRQLAKLHVTHSMDPHISPLRKLGEKCLAFSLSDRNTPIIGEIATLFITKFPEYVPKTLGELPGVAYYHALAPIDCQYPNSDGSVWMRNAVLKQSPLFDYDLFRGWVVKVLKDRNVILTPPICEPPKAALPIVKKPVVANGDILLPAAKPDQSGSSDVKKTKCRHFALGKCTYGAKCRFLHLTILVILAQLVFVDGSSLGCRHDFDSLSYRISAFHFVSSLDRNFVSFNSFISLSVFPIICALPLIIFTMSALAGPVVALGSLLAGAMKTRGVKRKKLLTAANRTTAVLVRKPPKKKRRLAMFSNTSSVMTSSSGPGGAGFIARNRFISGDSMTYKADSHNIFLLTDSSVPPNLLMATNGIAGIGTSVNTACNNSAYDLHPAGNTGASQAGPFGPSAISIATAFQRWRLVKLSMQYLPGVPANYSGIVSVGYRNDPFNTFTSPSVAMPFNVIAGSKNSVTGGANGLIMSARTNRPNYFGVDCVDVDSDAKWVWHSTASGVEQRTHFAGQLVCAGTGLLPNTVYGLLRLQATLQFWDISSQINVTQDPTLTIAVADGAATGSVVAPPVAGHCSTAWDSAGDGDSSTAPTYWFGTGAGTFTGNAPDLFTVDINTQTLTFNQAGRFQVVVILGQHPGTTFSAITAEPFFGGTTTATINAQSGSFNYTQDTCILNADVTTASVGETAVYYGPAATYVTSDCGCHVVVTKID